MDGQTEVAVPDVSGNECFSQEFILLILESLELSYISKLSFTFDAGQDRIFSNPMAPFRVLVAHLNKTMHGKMKMTLYKR